MNGGPAICFVLANPLRERPLEALERHVRSCLRALPGVGQVITPRWSPARRMGYGAGLRACVHSLRRRHRDLPPILLLKSGPGLALADVDEVLTIDPAVYAGIPLSGTRFYGPEIFHKLDVFKARGYERIVYLDCDTLVLDDVSALWDMEKYTGKCFYAVRETADMGVHPVNVGKLNTGVMVVNQPLLDGRAHRRMLEIARSGASYDGGDQGVINGYLEQDAGASVGELDPLYNVMVLVKKYGDWGKVRDRVRILHYTNRLKPWMPDHPLDVLFDAEFKRLWDEAYGLGPTTAFQDKSPGDLALPPTRTE